MAPQLRRTLRKLQLSSIDEVQTGNYLSGNIVWSGCNFACFFSFHPRKDRETRGNGPFGELLFAAGLKCGLSLIHPFASPPSPLSLLYGLNAVLGLIDTEHDSFSNEVPRQFLLILLECLRASQLLQHLCRLLSNATFSVDNMLVITLYAIWIF